jgi:hypothetical protein
MGLSSVFGNVGMHEFNNIVSDGRSKDGRHGDTIHNFVLVVF